MRLNLFGGLIAGLVVLALIVAYGTLFTVYQTRQALVVRLGQPVRVITNPGLNSKIPLIDSVINIDKRILDLENPAQEVIASDQKRLVVDAFARYRIKDVLKFYQTVGTVDGANSQLSILLNSALRRVLGEATLTQVVRDQREHLMARVREQLDNEAQGYGISVVDVRIRRADLPEQNSQAVYQRMQTERQQEAAQYRAEGAQKAQEMRAKARCCWPRHNRRASARAARAMASATAFSPTPTVATPTSSRSIVRCKPTRPGCAPMTRACCSNPIRSSSVSSWIQRASRAKVILRRAPQRLRGSGGLRHHCTG
jgi:regulator of protease activity HflC (stomatin/prohibitin superfamily)